MTRARFPHSYDDIISLENLLAAWKEFIRGKRKKADVREFQFNLIENIRSLHDDLKHGTYRHGRYKAFKIEDPKPRDIHKATVHDRLLHHAVCRNLYPFFDRTWIADSYSCRKGKGTHRAMNRFRSFASSVQAKHGICWILKCDIKKFFASIDQAILLGIVSHYIPDERINTLIAEVVGSFHSTKVGKGLPLGNLTSQVLVNVYMNEFDQFVKHRLRVERYIRYADDFVFLSANKQELVRLLPTVRDFLWDQLRLSLHLHKISMRTFASGVDFLGWVHFPDHRVLRTSTKKRMFRGIRAQEGKEETVQSYFGLISHGNAKKLRQRIETELLPAHNGGGGGG